MALGFTLIVFSLGSLMGIILNDQKLSTIEKDRRTQEVDFESLQFQYLYLDTVQTKDRCVVIEKALNANLEVLDKALAKLHNYENTDNLGEDYWILKRKYTIANLRYWLLAEQSEAECNADRVSVLYFHNGDQCEVCRDQGTLLSHLKTEIGENLLVFPLDTRFTDEPMISILQAQFNVTTYPTLIIEDNKIEGFVNEQQLLENICMHYKESYDVCQA